MVIIQSCSEVRGLSGLHLYHFGMSTCSQKVRLCLEHKGLLWTSHYINLTASENLTQRFFNISRNGLVPVLVHDGHTIIDSSDIMHYFEQMFPDRPLLPSDHNELAEVEKMVLLSDKTQEAVKYLSLFFLFGRFAFKTDGQLKRLSQSTTQRQSFEIYMAHKHGFDHQTIQQKINIMHSNFEMLESCLRRGHARVVGHTTTLADFAWAVIVHRMILAGFPMDNYPHVEKWFDVIKSSQTFKRAVTSWEPKWMVNLLRAKVRLYDTLGYGIRGFEGHVQTVWWLPLLLATIFIITNSFCPKYGIISPVKVTRSLLLSVLGGLVVGAVMWAYHKAHMPSLEDHSLPQRSSTPSMTAAVLVDYGGPQCLKVSTKQARPVLPEPGHVIVKVKCASFGEQDMRLLAGCGHNYLNHLRKKHQIAGGQGKEFPLIVGHGFSGVVEQIGAGITSLKAGDEVWGVSNVYEQGAACDYISVPHNYVSVKCGQMSWSRSAGLVLDALVAWQALTASHLQPQDMHGKRVLIHGGIGGVSLSAVQLVRAWGGTVTVTCTAAGAEILHRIGANDTIISDSQDLEASLKERERFDLVLQTVGSIKMLEMLLSMTERGGSVVSLMSPLYPLTSDYGLTIGWLATKYIWFKLWLTHSIPRQCLMWAEHRPDCNILAELSMLVTAGKLKSFVSQEFKLGHIHKAYAHLSQGHMAGSTVIHIH